MSINGIGSYQISANAPYAGQSANPVQGGGDVDRSRVTAPTAGRTGLFADTITQTLAQIGVTPSGANAATGATPTNSQQQALNGFVQNLFGALQDSSTPTTSNAVKSGQATRKEGRSATTTTAGLSESLQSGSLEGSIQNLAQQVTSGSSASDSDNLAALQQSFQNLVSTQGGDTDASLGSFLQALAQNIRDVPPTGSLISTSA
jgi:hypothetical protein